SRDLQDAGTLGRDFVQYRRKDCARVAPRGQERDQDRLLGVEHFRVEIRTVNPNWLRVVFAYVHVLVSHLLSLPLFAVAVPSDFLIQSLLIISDLRKVRPTGIQFDKSNV